MSRSSKRLNWRVVIFNIAGRSDRYADLVMPILLHNVGSFLDGRIGGMRNLKRTGGRPA